VQATSYPIGLMRIIIDLNIHKNRIMKPIIIILIISISILVIVYRYSSIIDGFKVDPIPRFNRPKPVIPTRPSPATNSNGGLVYIS